MVQGEEENPKSECRALFGTGLGHCCPFFPCQEQEACDLEVL